MRNMFRQGKVTEVVCDKTQVSCRVQYLDKQGLISKPIPVKQFGSRSTSAFWCPKVGDDVSVTMLPNADEDGFIDGSFYNTGNPPPITDPNTRHITFADGTVMQYSEGNSTLTINSKGPISVVTAGSVVIQGGSTVTVKAGTIILQGNVQITGTLQVQGFTTLSAGGQASPKIVNTDGSGGGS